MALQGTIDAFPLADVLQLLSASSKSGRLVLSGDRGRVTLWIDSGEVIGAESGSAAGERAELLLFEMLRFTEGAFEFDNELGDGAPPHQVPAAPLVECLEQALELLDSWIEIEAVVPSPRHRVSLVAELPEESVVIDAPTWRLLTAVGTSVAELAIRLELDEFSATSAVADLVRSGLVEVDEPIEAEEADMSLLDPVGVLDDVDGLGTGAEVSEPVDEDRLSSAPDGEHDEAAQDFPERFPIDDLIGASDDAEDDPWSSPEMERLEAQRFAAAQSFDAVEVEPLPLVDLGTDAGITSEDDAAARSAHEQQLDDSTAESTDEVLRQMSKLSPKAAEAIAAALNTVPASNETVPATNETADRNEDDGGGITFTGSF